jgi:hypothetical protein
MSNAQKVMQDLLAMVRDPVQPKLAFASAPYFKGEHLRMRSGWRGVAASPMAFSALVEAAAEIMEPDTLGGRSDLSKIILDAEKNGYFAFDGSVHDFEYADADEAAKGLEGKMRERALRPVSIIVRRVPFLSDFDCARAV